MNDLARDLRRERKAADPVALCAEVGLLGRHKRQPRGVIVRCPAHEEKNPSCSVRVADDGTIAVRCFSCGYSADAIGLIRLVLGLDHREALAWLARFVGRYDDAARLENGRTVQPSTPRPRPGRPTEPEPVIDSELYEAILDAYPLRAEPDVAAYARSRGLYAEAEAIGCGALPPPNAQREIVDAFGRDRLTAAGLMDERSASHLRDPEHRLIVPWRARDGRVLSLQRRVIIGSPPKKYTWPIGVPTPCDPFGADLFDDAVSYWRSAGERPEITFCEGAFDALALRAINRRRDEPRPRVVLALPSATTIRSEWSTYCDRQIVFVTTDADLPGDKAAADFVEKCCVDALEIFRERPVAAKDAAEILALRVN